MLSSFVYVQAEKQQVIFDDGLVDVEDSTMHHAGEENEESIPSESVP